uniref:NASP-related protein sim3 n=1 Tax=Talaromyces marneffei PM1 TaxID=1077442 RepID=A0A093W3R6_TALMA
MTSTEPTAELQTRLDNLVTRAAAKDAVKDYNAAAELYSQATEIQAQINGEMSVENADLLYAYGKSLYNVGVSKSDVLGSKIAGGETSQEPEPTAKKLKEPSSAGLIQATISSSTAQKSLDSNKATESTNQLFQFTGDENFADTDSEEEGEGAQAEEEEEEDDDFANAFEVLDLARILLLKKLEDVEQKSNDNGKSTDIPPEVRKIQERLADIYDLQAEISLEGESFVNAVSDLRAALELKEALFSFDDPSVSECHYKLSLALEFASVSQPDEENGEGKPTVVDLPMREQSAKHMQSAIESCKLRLAQEEKKLETGGIEGEDKINAAKRRIANVKEIVTDMEQRLVDLRRTPESVNAPSEDANAIEALNGVLGQLIGKSAAEKAATLDQVSKQANDLSSLVRKKTQPGSSGAKRQLESTEEPEGTKRAKTEDPA